MGLKILHVGKYYPPYMGGIEKVTYDLVETLNSNNIQTDVLCFNSSPKTIVQTGKYTIYRESRITSFKSTPISFTVFFRIKKICENYDLVHVHLPNPIMVIALMISGYKGKIVVHWHSDIIKQKWLKKIYNPIEKRFLKRVNKIICTSKNYMLGSSSLKEYHNKCVIIPIGVNSSDLIKNKVVEEKLRNQFEDKVLVFSLGRMVYYKGFEYLIKAMLNLEEKYILVIGGDGPDYVKLKNLIFKLGLANKVLLVGKIPNDYLGEYYRRATLFCLPSIERSEAYGVVQVEAMSFGCPVVSTNILNSGINWVNKHNVSGKIIDVKDSLALANTISEICENNELHTKLSKGAKKRFKEKFQLEQMTKKTIGLYQDLLS